MDGNFKIIKAYQENAALRAGFDELAKKTFDLSFEDWYQNGFWGEKYIPYSVLDGERVVANVSVNRMNLLHHGEKKHLIQLGTVMTDKAYRNRGLIRSIMQEIEKDYQDKTEGMYLFANDSVLDFYPKFGFSKAVEYQYTKEVRITGEGVARLMPMQTKSDWSVLKAAIERSVPAGGFEMVDNAELILFYVTKFMQKNVFYIDSMETYVIAEMEADELTIDNVFAEKLVDLEEIIRAFGKQVKRVRLNFTPLSTSGFEVRAVQEDDTTLFVKGKGLLDFEADKKMFPALSHA